MNLFQMFLGEHFDVSEPIKAIKPSIDASGNMLIWFANPIYCPNMKRPHSEVPHTFFVAHRRLKKLYMKCKDCQCKKINLKREKALPPSLFDELWPQEIGAPISFFPANRYILLLA